MNKEFSVNVPMSDLMAVLDAIQLLSNDYGIRNGIGYNENQRMALMAMLTAGNIIMEFVMRETYNPNFDAEINRLFGIE